MGIQFITKFDKKFLPNLGLDEPVLLLNAIPGH